MDVNSNNKSNSDEQMMDILLVFDKEKKTINVVKGIDENGELQTVPPKQKHNNDFLKVDKQGNALENFLKNFFILCREAGISSRQVRCWWKQQKRMEEQITSEWYCLSHLQMR